MAIAPEPKLQTPPPPPATDAQGFPRWPLWLPVAALAGGLAWGFLMLSMLAGVLDATGIETDPDAPGLTAAGTVIIDLAVVVTAVGLAALTLRPRAWHFSLRGARLRSAAGVAGLGVCAFFLFEWIYVQIVHDKNPQTVVDDLGADRNTALAVAGAIVVIAVAPICEELFFRGFLFRVLRARLPLWIAAVADGILFGLVHGSLVILPILAFLGIVLCYVLENTGTLFATIAIHALNNTLSYGFLTDDGWVPAVCVGVAMLAACALGVARSARGDPAAVANPAARLDLPSPG